MLKTKRHNIFIKTISLLVVVCFSLTMVLPPEARAQFPLSLPAPGAIVPLSNSFVPVMLRGLKVYPDDPLKFDFIVDSGNTGLKEQELKSESEKLAKYFLASLTTPEEDLWVNLSPYEEDRIIPEAFGQTDMGRDLLAQDYILKQITASLILPDSETGKDFWQKVYQKAYEAYGTTNIPVNTFNKVWIVPEKAVIYEDKDKAFVTESYLKVMLEQDYLSLKNNSQNKALGTSAESQDEVEKTSELSSNIVREIILPLLEKEVNEGKNFANLRQIYHAMVLATWYKQALKTSILNKVYADKNKVNGVNGEDPEITDKIYNQYLEAFKKGVCNLIKVEKDPSTQRPIARKYFSGGFGSSPEHPGKPISSILTTNPLKTLKLAATIFIVGTIFTANVVLGLGSPSVKADNAGKATSGWVKTSDNQQDIAPVAQAPSMDGSQENNQADLRNSYEKWKELISKIEQSSRQMNKGGDTMPSFVSDSMGSIVERMNPSNIKEYLSLANQFYRYKQAQGATDSVRADISTFLGDFILANLATYILDHQKDLENKIGKEELTKIIDEVENRGFPILGQEPGASMDKVWKNLKTRNYRYLSSKFSLSGNAVLWVFLLYSTISIFLLTFPESRKAKMISRSVFALQTLLFASWIYVQFSTGMIRRMSEYDTKLPTEATRSPSASDSLFKGMQGVTVNSVYPFEDGVTMYDFLKNKAMMLHISNDVAGGDFRYNLRGGVSGKDFSDSAKRGRLIADFSIGFESNSLPYPTDFAFERGVPKGLFMSAKGKDGWLLVYPDGTMNIVNKNHIRLSDVFPETPADQDRTLNIRNPKDYTILRQGIKKNKISVSASLLLYDADASISPIKKDRKSQNRFMIKFKDGSWGVMKFRESMKITEAVEKVNREMPGLVSKILYCDAGAFDFIGFYPKDKTGNVKGYSIGAGQKESYNRLGVYYNLQRMNEKAKAANVKLAPRKTIPRSSSTLESHIARAKQLMLGKEYAGAKKYLEAARRHARFEEDRVRIDKFEQKLLNAQEDPQIQLKQADLYEGLSQEAMSLVELGKPDAAVRLLVKSNEDVEGMLSELINKLLNRLKVREAEFKKGSYNPLYFLDPLSFLLKVGEIELSDIPEEEFFYYMSVMLDVPEGQFSSFAKTFLEQEEEDSDDIENMIKKQKADEIKQKMFKHYEKREAQLESFNQLPGPHPQDVGSFIMNLDDAFNLEGEDAVKYFELIYEDISAEELSLAAKTAKLRQSTAGPEKIINDSVEQMKKAIVNNDIASLTEMLDSATPEQKGILEKKGMDVPYQFYIVQRLWTDAYVENTKDDYKRKLIDLLIMASPSSLEDSKRLLWKAFFHFGTSRSDLVEQRLSAQRYYQSEENAPWVFNAEQFKDRAEALKKALSSDEGILSDQKTISSIMGAFGETRALLTNLAKILTSPSEEFNANDDFGFVMAKAILRSTEPGVYENHLKVLNKMMWARLQFANDGEKIMMHERMKRITGNDKAYNFKGTQTPIDLTRYKGLYDRLSTLMEGKALFKANYPIGDSGKEYVQAILSLRDFPDAKFQYRIGHAQDEEIPFIMEHLGGLWKKIIDKATPAEERFKFLAEYEWWFFQANPLARGGASLGDAMSTVAQLVSGIPLRKEFEHLDFDALSMTLQDYIVFRSARLAEQGKQGAGDGTSTANLDTKGGIDLNAANLNLQRKGEAIQFDMPQELENIDLNNFQGFTPTVINIVPVTDFNGLLGLTDDGTQSSSDNLSLNDDQQQSENEREIVLLRGKAALWA